MFLLVFLESRGRGGARHVTTALLTNYKPCRHVRHNIVAMPTRKSNLQKQKSESRVSISPIRNQFPSSTSRYLFVANFAARALQEL